MMISTHSSFREGFMRWGTVLVCLLLLAPAGLTAQATSDDVAARLKALEERLRALEAELAALKAAQGTPPTPAAAPGGPAGQLPVYGGTTALSKILNPDIGVIGNFTGAVGRNRVNPLPSLSLQESEVSLQAIVDPYARADFFLAFGEEGVEVEEGYITFPALPGGLLVK